MRQLSVPSWLALAAMCVALTGAIWEGMPGRAVVTASMLVIAPGLAVAALGGIRDPLVLSVVTIPAGLSVVGLVALTLVYSDLMSTELITAVLTGVTVIAAAAATMDRTARGVLLLLATLPGVVLLSAELARGLP